MGTFRTRYAPSPTGDLHLGHLRAHLLTWLLAKKNDGVIVMRIEDLDPPREVRGSADAIMRTHEWMGLGWDEGPFYQSKQKDKYEEALQSLRGSNVAYPCVCSRADIAALSAPHGDLGPIYPGTCRTLESTDRPHAFRFVMNEDTSCFDDKIFGQQHFSPAGDFVIRRKDQLFAYHLAVVVDDDSMGITDIIRGADLLPSTPRHIAIQRALHLSVPNYFHMGLVLDKGGKRLAKRHQSVSINQLKDAGATPQSLFARLAPSLNVTVEGGSLSLDELLERFDFETAKEHLKADQIV